MSDCERTLRTLKRFLVVASFTHLSACVYVPRGINPANYPHQIADAQFVTADLRRFWTAYENGGREGSAMAFQSIYLDSASPGLRNFMKSRAVTAASLVGVVSAYRSYFEALEPVSRAIDNSNPIFNVVRANYERIAGWYPQAFFPPVTLLVGRFSTGGTTGEAGMLLGMEFYGVDAKAPVGELNAFAHANQFSLRDDFPSLVAHEHAHLLQVAAGAQGSRSGKSLLARALIEGGADFLAELASGQASYHRKYVAWQARETDFWTAFQRDMRGRDVSHWLYNQRESTANWPGDLGYFMGYRIAQAFFMQAVDKHAAVRELVAQRDPERILERSGYAGRGPMISVSGAP